MHRISSRLVASFIVLFSAFGVANAQTDESPIQNLTLSEGSLGFCGVYLGQPLVELESDVGAQIPLNVDEMSGTQTTGAVTACGRHVTFNVDTETRSAASVNFIWIGRHPEDPAYLWDLASMRSLFRSRFSGAYYFEGPYEPGLTELEDDTPQYRLEGAPNQLVVLKPEESIYLEVGDGYD